jgi:outer membrane protein OmpA-like peptidoglycan-associated protein
MIKSSLIWSIAVPIGLVLATSGCATKKYVRQQVAPVNQKVAAVQKESNDKIAAVWQKENSDISQVNERISTTDQKLAQVAETANQAQGTASRAMETADSNSSKIEENKTAISSLGTGVANALNFQLVEKADVMFGFNKSTLTPAARTALDEVASKYQSLPRGVIELYGFTDTVGSKTYNLALSRRRAEAVQRYLVNRKVPLRAIHIVGLGEEKPPAGLEADMTAMNGGAPNRAQRRQLERRVKINLYGAGDINSGTASRSDQDPEH